jgi:spore maturation protein CgeB
MTKRLLLLSPVFHGIWRGLESALDELGFSTRWHLYDENPTYAARLRYKAQRELPRYFGVDPEPAHRRDVTSKAVAALRSMRPDYVLIVKGERLEHAFWDALDQSGAKRLLWLYDDYRRIGFRPELLARAGAVASFSLSDVDSLPTLGVRSHYLPLAFEPGIVPVRPPTAEGIVFAGARYPYRESLLRRMLEAGLPVRAYGRQWSHHPIDRARTWDPRRPAIPAGRDLTRPHLYGHLLSASAALNVHDGAQDGFNLRTFEACGVGGLQLIDRPDVSQFYDVGTEIAVYQSDEELIDLAGRALSDPAWRSRLGAAARRRTLAQHTMTDRARELVTWWA